MKHIIKIKIFLFLIMLFRVDACQAENSKLAAVFEKFQVEGTIVISSLKNGTTYRHNDKRALEQLSPASTFKIVNTLIALEEKVVANENVIIPWDGVKRDFESWNQDQTLVSAFKSSCLWVYQWVAQKVNVEKYQHYLTQINYGNKTPGPEIATFWLKGGDLKISPAEQVEILRHIYKRTYGFSETSYDVLKKIMLVAETDSHRIYVKTGAATKDWIGHGWYVGYIETEDDTWFFATNIKINGFETLALREKVTFACLEAILEMAL